MEYSWEIILYPNTQPWINELGAEIIWDTSDDSFTSSEQAIKNAIIAYMDVNYPGSWGISLYLIVKDKTSGTISKLIIPDDVIDQYTNTPGPQEGL
jgi:hypothetical protein